MKSYKRIVISILSLSAFLTGCGHSDMAKISPDITTFTDGYTSKGDAFYCYMNDSGAISILQYDTMTTSPLCNKPNCTHSGGDCIMRQLGGTTPILVDNYAYYFIDDPVSVIEDEDTGKKDLKLSTALYRYDLSSYQSEKLAEIDGVSATNNCYGWQIYQGKMYVVGNCYSRTYDENGSLLNYRGNGGEMLLYSIELTSYAVTNHGALYHPDQLQTYYPEVANSGEVYLKGVYQDKLYYEVAFVELAGDGEDPSDFDYVGYVASFDPATNTCSEAPDPAAMEYCEIAFLSEDAMVISQDGNQLAVYQNGVEMPITLEDPDFFRGVKVAVYDGVLYYDGNAYDLATGATRHIPELENSTICAEYQETYILGDESGQGDFRKVSAEELLPSKS